MKVTLHLPYTALYADDIESRAEKSARVVCSLIQQDPWHTQHALRDIPDRLMRFTSGLRGGVSVCMFLQPPAGGMIAMRRCGIIWKRRRTVRRRQTAKDGPRAVQHTANLSKSLSEQAVSPFHNKKMFRGTTTVGDHTSCQMVSIDSCKEKFGDGIKVQGGG